MVAGVRSGGGAVGMFEGSAGIGKTALLAEAARRASGLEFLVLRAAGAPLESEYVFGVVRELFAAVMAGRGSDDLLEGAAGLAAAPVGLVPATAGVAGAWGDPVPAAMHGLYWLTARLAQRAPLLLAIDDAHWADVMSLRFVLYLARRLEDLPVVVLVAARLSAGLEQGKLLAELGVLPEVVVLRPAPLTEPQAARLIGERGVPDADDRFVVACHHASGGNPFLLGEMVGRLRVDGARGTAADAARVATIAPEGIVRWVSVRLAALGKRAERLAAAYVVLGGGASLSDAAVLAGIEPSIAAATADALIGADILTGSGSYEFVHPLIRAAVSDGLAAATRAEWHERAARLTAARGAPLGVVAAHLMAASPGSDDWAVEVLRAAAREASASGAPGTAANYLERALADARSRELRADLLVELGRAQLDAGLEGATQSIRDALDLLDDPRRRGKLWLLLGRALFSTGDQEQAQESLRSGLAEIPDDEEDLLLELRAWYTADTHDDPQLTAATQARLRDLLDHDSPGRTRAERLTLAHLAYRSARSGERTADSVARLARRALANGALLADSGSDMGPYSAACHALAAAGEPAAAIDELDPAIELSQRRGLPVPFGWFSSIRGIAHYQLGHLIDAIADLEQASHVFDDAHVHLLHDPRPFLALCLIERDDLTGAGVALALTDGEPSDELQRSSSCSYLYAFGRFRIARGQLREGLAALLGCEHWVRVTNAPNPAANLAWRADAAQLLASLGEQDRAHAVLGDTVSVARAFGAPHALGIALRARGLIEGDSTGLESLADAVAVLDGAGFDLQLARTLTEQGAALRRVGQRQEALEPLRRGLDLAVRCGAVVLSKRARDELVAAGARPRRARISGADALTASELRVARMAAEGMSNPQIGQALFISRKTVTVHLTRIYQKLDIESRAQLARSLVEH